MTTPYVPSPAGTKVTGTMSTIYDTDGTADVEGVSITVPTGYDVVVAPPPVVDGETYTRNKT